jgi:glycosyltransferase involved in cell wall biosynthesis
LAEVKDQITLVRAFLGLLERMDDASRLRLVLIGDGPLMPTIKRMLQEAGATDRVWLAGSREDVPQLLRELDIFVLPSLGEGISNTILEAMASGLPVVATNVGGNSELVIEGETGTLVPAADAGAMANAIQYYINSAQDRHQHSQSGRQRVEATFSMQSMVRGYLDVYDSLVQRSR